MSLPKISAPIFSTILPSTGEKIRYQPFRVREEKILLIAQESGDLDQIILATKQVINNSVIDDIDIDALPVFDIQWLLLHIRAASVDNTLNFQIKDDYDELINLTLDINDIKPFIIPEHTNRIKADEEYTIIMRYPTIVETYKIMALMRDAVRLKKLIDEAAEIDVKKQLLNDLRKLGNNTIEYDIMVSCMSQVVSESEVFNFSDSTPEEINSFVESLDPKVVPKIKEFFETMPTIRHEIPYVDSKGNAKVFVLEGFESFFT